jgi:hypothetical protein
MKLRILRLKIKVLFRDRKIFQVRFQGKNLKR